MNVLVLDAATQRPTGIPCQISKNWHNDDNPMYAGYHGTWWTANVMLRLPANSTISVKFAIAYELYGRVSAFSHAAKHRRLLEQVAVGAGGAGHWRREHLF